MATKQKKKSRQLPVFPEYVDILGTPYSITITTHTLDPGLDDCYGYCSSPMHKIAILNLFEYDQYNKASDSALQTLMKRTLRHEIIHAFLRESGLGEQSFRYEKTPWPLVEEMIDWWALQGLKVYKAWSDANCLEFMSPEEYTKYMTWKNGGNQK